MRVTGMPYSSADMAVHLPVPFCGAQGIANIQSQEVDIKHILYVMPAVLVTLAKLDVTEFKICDFLKIFVCLEII